MSNQVTQTIIVKRDLPEVYRLWADFENFPRFMKHISSVTKTGDRSSHWVMEGPLGARVEWEAETTMLEPNKRIAWNSKDRSPVTTSGQVTFNALRDHETEVTLLMHYDPPAGMAGDLVAKFFGDLRARVDEDLRNFKAYAEGMTARTPAGQDKGERSRRK